MQANNSCRLSLIAAVTPEQGIGKNNALLWHEPLDQQHFRQVTMGCPVIMGRRTWDSLPERFRPLPGRSNIVMTRNPHWQAQGALVARSLDEALRQTADAVQAFVIGGAEIYALALARADELVLTEIDQNFACDAYFPPWDRSTFKEYSRERHTSSQGIGFSFVRYRRSDGI
jgi:dihydrofolate reductase